MGRAIRVARHLESTVTGPMWHGPALMELLDGVSGQQALARPLADAHTIWEIVQHVIAWCEIARLRLDGQATGDPTPDQDWPPVTAPPADPDADWRRAVERLAASHRDLAAATRRLDDTALDTLVPGLDYTISVLLRGIVEHGTYHGGQIALLKRAAGQP